MRGSGSHASQRAPSGMVPASCADPSQSVQLSIVGAELRRTEECLADATTQIGILKAQLHAATGGEPIVEGSTHSLESALSRSLTSVVSPPPSIVSLSAVSPPPSVVEDGKGTRITPLSSLRHIPVSRLAIPVGSRPPPSVRSSRSARSENGERRSESSFPSALRVLSNMIQRVVDPAEAKRQDLVVHIQVGA